MTAVPSLPSRPDPRLRMLDWVLDRIGTPVANMTLADIQAARAQKVTDNPGSNLLFGTPAQDVAVTDLRIPGDRWEAPVRVYRPPGAANLPVVVFYHGGGWVLGNVTRARWLCSQLASQAGVVVFAVGYRLAPEHRFPVATDDAWAGLAWVVDHADEHGGDAARLAVMGSSAGGNLAAVVTLRARDEAGPPIALQTLIYPATDATVDGRSMATQAEAPMLTRDDMATFYSHYTGGVADAFDPRLSPLHADSLADLPPALVITAAHDPLRDEGRRYADKLRAHGTPVRYTDYTGMTHGFMSYPGLVGGARQALAEIVQVHRTTFADHPA